MKIPTETAAVSARSEEMLLHAQPWHLSSHYTDMSARAGNYLLSK